MLTRNKARLLNIEIPPISMSNIERKRTNKKCSQMRRSRPKMVSFEDNNENINDLPVPISLYEVNIDFDDAHEAWTSNKIKQKNGCYKYRKTIPKLK